MKKNLRNIENIFLYHFIDGRKIPGKHSSLIGDYSGLRGDCSRLTGDGSRLTGDCSNIIGDGSLFEGDFDQCEITNSERYEGISITDLVADS
ncbi:hypothetical protein LCGC14_0405380 [marine sediment metagenome]|uniref:Uncharacterized protein n=1 Tax=marine sediment metagenome TaxID=412755 RepID=A0A0F9T156_9ZZZZ